MHLKIKKYMQKEIHTGFGSVKLDGITQLATSSSIQHQHASRNAREWPEIVEVTSH